MNLVQSYVFILTSVDLFLFSIHQYIHISYKQKWTRSGSVWIPWSNNFLTGLKNWLNLFHLCLILDIWTYIIYLGNSTSSKWLCTRHQWFGCSFLRCFSFRTYRYVVFSISIEISLLVKTFVREILRIFFTSYWRHLINFSYKM